MTLSHCQPGIVHSVATRGSRHLCLPFMLFVALLCAACSSTAPEVIPNAPSTSPMTSATTTTNGSLGHVGRGSITAAPQVPGGCSSTFHIEGNVDDLPSADRTLWVIKLNDANPDQGDPNPLHFPKSRIDRRTGQFSLDVPSSTPAGYQSTGKFLLAVANQAADEELQSSYESDVSKDKSYADGKRVHLPAGADAIAMSNTVEQHC
jgi:hypothetical protein